MSSSPRGKTLLDTMLLTLSAAALPLSWFLLRKSGRRGAAGRHGRLRCPFHPGLHDGSHRCPTTAAPHAEGLAIR